MVTCLRRSARDCETWWERSGIPRWDHAIATLWWRRGGHIAQREPGRWLSAAMHWRDAMYLHAPRAVYWRASGPTRLRLNHRHRHGVNRLWDAPIQAFVKDSVGEGSKWQDVAQCKETWSALEPTFAQRVTRTLVLPTPVPPGRWVMRSTPDDSQWL